MESMPPRQTPASPGAAGSTVPSKSKSKPGSGAGLAVASLVLGIVGVLTSVVVVGAFLGVVGLTLGVIHLYLRKESVRMARWGAGLSTAAVVASVGFLLLYVMGMRRASEWMPDGPGQGRVAQWVGKPAPDFEVTAIDGTRWRLSELRGRPVVLDFWATWCPPCVKEIPHFVQLRGSVGTNDLMILGLSSEDRAVLKPFVAANAMNYPVASLVDVEVPEPFSSINALPTTVFLDRDGIVRQVLVGYHDLRRLREAALGGDAGEGRSPAP